VPGFPWNNIEVRGLICTQEAALQSVRATRLNIGAAGRQVITSSQTLSSETSLDVLDSSGGPLALTLEDPTVPNSTDGFTKLIVLRVPGNSVTVTPGTGDILTLPGVSPGESATYTWDGARYTITAQPQGGGTITMGDGTEALPGLAFTLDSDTGFWRSGANTLDVSTGGVRALRVDSNQNLLVPNGQVLADAGTAAAPGSSFASDPDSGTYSIGPNRLGLATNGTLGLEVTANQNVLIPNGQLLSGAGGVGAPPVSFDGDADTGMYRVGPNELGIGTGGIIGLRIDSNQDVWLDNGDLNVNGNLTVGSWAFAGQLLIQDGAVGTPGLAFDLDTNSGLYRVGNDEIALATAGVQGLRVDSNQDVFVDNGDLTVSGTVTATSFNFVGQLLSQDGNVAAPGISFAADTNTGFYRIGADDIGVSTGATQAMEIDSSQNVTVPNGQIRSSDGVVATPGVAFAADTDTGIYRVAPNDIGFVTGGTLGMRIDSLQDMYVPNGDITCSGDVQGSTLTSTGGVAAGGALTGVTNIAMTGTITGGTDITVSGIISADRFTSTGGQILSADGTVAAPGIGFSSDTNSGLYRIGADDIGIATNGTLALEVDASQNVRVPNGQVLWADGVAGAPGCAFAADPNTGIYRVGIDTLGVATGGVVGLRIDSNQDVWVPNGDLNVNGNVSAITFTFAGQLLVTDGVVGAPGLAFSLDTNSGLYRLGADDIALATNGTLGLEVNATQDVSVPNGQLLVANGSNLLPAVSFGTDPNSGLYRVGVDDIALATNATQALRIDANQDVTIPNGDLTVTGDVEGTTLTSTGGVAAGGAVSGVTNIAMTGTITGGTTIATSGTITAGGAFLSSDGAAATPGYAFSADADSGMYRIGVNDIGLSTNATLGLEVNATQDVLVPNGQLLGADGAVGLPEFSFGLDPDTGMYRIGANQLGFATAGVSGLYIDAAQDVWIPNGNLDVTGSITAASFVFGGQILATDGLVGAPGISFALDPDSGIYRIGANDVGLSTGGVLALEANATQDVAVPNGQILASDGAVGAPGVSFGTDADVGLYRIGVNDLGISTNATLALEVNATQDVAVPNGQILASDGTNLLPGVSFGADANSGLYRVGADDIALATNATQALRIDVNQDVTVPNGDLTVTGDVQGTTLTSTGGVAAGGAVTGVTNIAMTGTITGGTTIATSGTITAGGAFLASDGAVGAPGYAFTADPDSGIYRIGANDVGISTNATLALEVNATQDVAVPNGQILASDGSNLLPGVSFGTDPDVGIYRIGVNDIGIATNATLGLEVNATQDVSVPNGQLLASDGSNLLPGVSFGADPNSGLYRVGADDIALATNAIQALRIDVNQDVTIPNGDLTVTGDVEGTTLTSTGGVAAGGNVTGVVDIAMTGNIATPVNVTASGAVQGATLVSTGTTTAGAAFLASDGAVGAPGYSYTLDTNSGIYRIGVDDLGIATNGTLGLEVNATQDVAVPNGQLLASDGAVGVPGVSFGADPNTGLYRVGVDNLGIATAGVLGLRIDANQDVWIPNGDLDVSGSVTAASFVFAGQLLATDGVVGAPGISFAADTNSGVYRIGADDIGIATNGTLGIELNATQDVAFPNGQVLASDGTNLLPGLSFGADPNSGLYRVGVDDIALATNATQALRIDVNQDVTIPNGDLTVTGDVQGTTLTSTGGVAVGGALTGVTNITLTGSIATATTITASGNIQGASLTSTTGQVLSADGTAGSPGYSFVADTNSGVYRIGADDIGISTNATLGLEVNATQDVSVPNGQILGADGAVGLPEFSFGTDPDSGLYRIGINDVGISTNGTLGLRIDANQDVTMPNGDLTVTGDVEGTTLTSTGGIAAGGPISGVTNLTMNGTITTPSTITTNSTITAGGQFLGDPLGGLITPGYSFTGDTDTGMYWVNVDSVGLCTLSTAGLTIDNAQNVDVPNGNITCAGDITAAAGDVEGLTLTSNGGVAAGGAVTGVTNIAGITGTVSFGAAGTLTVPNYAVAPAVAAEGSLFWDSALNELNVSDAASWLPVLTGVAVSSPDALVRWDGATGSVVKNSGVTLDDNEYCSGIKRLDIVNVYADTGPHPALYVNASDTDYSSSPMAPGLFVYTSDSKNNDGIFPLVIFETGSPTRQQGVLKCLTNGTEGNNFNLKLEGKSADVEWIDSDSSVTWKGKYEWQSQSDRFRLTTRHNGFPGTFEVCSEWPSLDNTGYPIWFKKSLLIETTYYSSLSTIYLKGGQTWDTPVYDPVGIIMYDTDETAADGKWEMYDDDKKWKLRSRDSGDTGWEEVISTDQRRSTLPFRLYKCLQIDPYTPDPPTDSTPAIRLLCDAPNMIWDDDQETDPAGEYEIKCNADELAVRGRDSLDSSYEEIFVFERLANTTSPCRINKALTFYYDQGEPFSYTNGASIFVDDASTGKMAIMCKTEDDGGGADVIKLYSQAHINDPTDLASCIARISDILDLLENNGLMDT